MHPLQRFHNTHLRPSDAQSRFQQLVIGGQVAASLKDLRSLLRKISLRRISFVTLLCSLILIGSGCISSRTPVTPGVIPQGGFVSAEDEAYGHQVLSTLTATYPLARDDAAIQRVRGLVQRLAQAGKVDSHPWNVFVLDDARVINAAATRGNYLFVWTGMLRIAQRDGELATVVAHELGHLLANHTQPTAAEEANEIMARTSGRIAGQIVAMDPYYGPLAQLAAVVVTEAVKAIAVNPESQRLETEADHIGFFLMADAGFDPHDALAFWSAMSRTASSTPAGLSFLNSHPDSEDRLEALQALLPEALARYQQATSPRSPKKKRTRPATMPDDSFALP
jgi:predicted Zn-dependent protease